MEEKKYVIEVDIVLKENNEDDTLFIEYPYSMDFKDVTEQLDTLKKLFREGNDKEFKKYFNKHPDHYWIRSVPKLYKITKERID